MAEANSKYAFTLIELLIVVAIISILSAIAVPNFLEAQTRAKVSRTKNDQRTMANAVEMYRVDNNVLPLRRDMDGYGTSGAVAWPFPPVLEKGKYMPVFTTPIAYINSIPDDLFAGDQLRAMTGGTDSYSRSATWMDYWDDGQTKNFLQVQKNSKTYDSRGNYTFVSVGPDRYMGIVKAYVGGRWGYPAEPSYLSNTAKHFYDPTNGTVSAGNIYRWNIDIPQGEVYPKMLP